MRIEFCVGCRERKRTKRRSVAERRERKFCESKTEKSESETWSNNSKARTSESRGVKNKKDLLS